MLGIGIGTGSGTHIASARPCFCFIQQIFFLFISTQTILFTNNAKIAANYVYNILYLLPRKHKKANCGKRQNDKKKYAPVVLAGIAGVSRFTVTVIEPSVRCSIVLTSPLARWKSIGLCAKTNDIRLCDVALCGARLLVLCQRVFYRRGRPPLRQHCQAFHWLNSEEGLYYSGGHK